MDAHILFANCLATKSQRFVLQENYTSLLIYVTMRGGFQRVTCVLRLV